jgi:hypothetical protein
MFMRRHPIVMCAIFALIFIVGVGIAGIADSQIQDLYSVEFDSFKRLTILRRLGFFISGLGVGGFLFGCYLAIDEILKRDT